MRLLLVVVVVGQHFYYFLASYHYHLDHEKISWYEFDSPPLQQTVSRSKSELTNMGVSMDILISSQLCLILSNYTFPDNQTNNGTHHLICVRRLMTVCALLQYKQARSLRQTIRLSLHQVATSVTEPNSYQTNLSLYKQPEDACLLSTSCLDKHMDSV